MAVGLSHCGPICLPFLLPLLRELSFQYSPDLHAEDSTPTPGIPQEKHIGLTAPAEAQEPRPDLHPPASVGIHAFILPNR